MSLNIDKLKRLEANLKTHKDAYKKAIENHKDRLVSLESKSTKSKFRPSIKFQKKEICLRKPKINASLSSKTVLTDSTWEYVEIFLKSSNNNEALFYCEQARNFYEATKTLSIVSKPLTAYYCFLNATKALLTAKNIGYDTKCKLLDKSATHSCSWSTTHSYSKSATQIKKNKLLFLRKYFLSVRPA